MEDFVCYFTNRFGSDLMISFCGYEQCSASHSYGPVIREEYILPFLFHGEGTYCVEGQEFPLQKGDAFLIRPNQPHQYYATPNNPYAYFWLAFVGLEAERLVEQIGFAPGNHLITPQDPSAICTLLKNLKAQLANKSTSYMYAMSCLYELFGMLMQENENMEPVLSQSDGYIRRALDYIELNYMKEISVEDVADFLSLNRSYFSSLFREKLGVAPQQYLISLRINKVSKLLLTTNYSVERISHLVGFNNLSNFCLQFKNRKECTPSELREYGERARYY